MTPDSVARMATRAATGFVPPPYPHDRLGELRETARRAAEAALGRFALQLGGGITLGVLGGIIAKHVHRGRAQREETCASHPARLVFRREHPADEQPRGELSHIVRFEDDKG